MLSRAEAIVKAENYLESRHHDSIWNLVDETECVASHGIGLIYVFIYLIDDSLCVGIDVFADGATVTDATDNNFRWNAIARKVEWGYFGDQRRPPIVIQ